MKIRRTSDSVSAGNACDGWPVKMNKKPIATILLGALAGRAKDASLPMYVNKIRRLCGKVGYAAFI